MLTSLRPASPSKRLLAFALDYVVILGYMAALTAITFGLATVSRSQGGSTAWPDDPLQADLLAFVTLILPVTLYFAVLEGSARGATWGKRKAALRVSNAHGGQLSRKQALARSALKFLPWQIAHTCLFHIEGWPTAPGRPTPLIVTGFVLVGLMVAAGVGMALLSSDGRTPYDRATGAYVIVDG